MTPLIPNRLITSSNNTIKTFPSINAIRVGEIILVKDNETQNNNNNLICFVSLILLDHLISLYM